MENKDLDNNIDINKGFSNKDSEDYKKSVDKIAQEEDAWKTDSFVYTPKEIAPPKAFNFTLKGKQTPIDLDFKKTDLDFLKKSQENENLVLTPEGLTPAKTNFENEPTSLATAKNKAKRDDFYTNQESYTYNENPDRRVITPNPADLPANEYCPDDHVFENQYTTNYDKKSQRTTDYKTTRTTKKNKTDSFTIAKTIVGIVLAIIVSVTLNIASKKYSFYGFVNELFYGQKTTPDVAEIFIPEINKPILEEPSSPQTEILEGTIKIEAFHEYIGSEVELTFEYVSDYSYYPYNISGFYEYAFFQDEKEEMLKYLENYIFYLKDIEGFKTSFSPAGLYLTGVVEGVYISILINQLDSTHVTGETITIEYKEYVSGNIVEFFDWGIDPNILNN